MKSKAPSFNQIARQLGCAAAALLLSTAVFNSVKADGIGFNPTTKPGQMLVAGLRAVAPKQYTYVYVKEGESLSYQIERAGGNSSGNFIAYSFYSPQGQVGTTETIFGTDGVSRIGSITATAQTAGIWVIEMTLAGTLNTWRYDFNAVSDASDPAGSRIGGRVYMEILNITQSSAASNIIDIPLYLHTPSGHKYDVIFTGYNGVTSRISSDQFGIAKKSDCGVSVYRSAEGADPDIRDINLPTCGVQNKLFFSASDPALPTSAPRWNIVSGQTTNEWLNPALSGPVVTELAYAPTAGPNSLAGNFTLKISDHVGAATLQLDMDNDGVYGGTNDRSVPFLVANANTITVPFDGLGASGSPLPAGSTIKAKVLVDKTGEVHFTMLDVELLAGVKITRTTGDPANNTLLYWNDTLLTEAGKSSVTPQKDGISGVESNSANGVHGWSGNGVNQWGNDRLIDNWTYASAAATQEITIENCAANAGTISR